MFEKVVIKSRLGGEENQLSIAELIDSMLFYGEINLIAHKDEMSKLLKAFGEELLRELILNYRLKINVRNKILGSTTIEAGEEVRYGFDIMHKVNQTIESILYSSHRNLVKNSTENNKFVERFIKLIQPFEYRNGLTTHIGEDFQNDNYIKKALKFFINTQIPDYIFPEEFRFSFIEDDTNMPLKGLYRIDTDLNISEINSRINANRLNQIYDFRSDFVLSLAESRGDNYISAQFESELITSDKYAGLINIQLSDAVNKALNSEKDISFFNEYVLDEYDSLGEAYVNGQISNKQLLSTLYNGEKFREWLNEVGQDKNVVKEYIKRISEKNNSDKKWVKCLRYGLTTVLGGIPILGNLASAGDAFLVDKIINGWKPNLFVDEKLKPILPKKDGH